MDKKFLLASVLASVLAFQNAVADDAATPVATSPADNALEAPANDKASPTEVASATQPESSVPFITGGVGEEMDHMKAIQDQYNLKLLITEENGTFLSDVGVNIMDKDGHALVHAVTKGPVLLATLPEGTYKVTVQRRDGEAKEQKAIIVAGKLSAYEFSFSNTDPKISGDPKTTTLK